MAADEGVLLMIGLNRKLQDCIDTVQASMATAHRRGSKALLCKSKALRHAQSCLLRLRLLDHRIIGCQRRLGRLSCKLANNVVRRVCCAKLPAQRLQATKTCTLSMWMLMQGWLCRAGAVAGVRHNFLKGLLHLTDSSFKFEEMV